MRSRTAAALDKSPDYEAPNCTAQGIELLLSVAPMRKKKTSREPSGYRLSSVSHCQIVPWLNMLRTGGEMSTWFHELLKVLGALTPFVYGLAVYKFFHYLDGRASAKAKDAVREWFKPFGINYAQVSAAILEFFDKLYGSQLLSWRSFLRSARFTLIVTIISALTIAAAFQETILDHVDDLEVVSHRWYLAGFALGLSIMSNVVSDYISLFFVRRSLNVNTTSPLLFSFLSAMVGIFVVVLIFLGRVLFIETFLDGGTMIDILNSVFGFGELTGRIGLSWFAGEYELFVTEFSKTLLIPAILVHLWLPLLALGVILIKFFNLFLAAVTWTQWFIKQGRNHPLDAIGYVSGVATFIITATLQLLGRWSSP